jgi:hypothetical protein
MEMITTAFRRAASAFAFALLVSFAAAPSFASTEGAWPTVPNPGMSDRITGVSTVSSTFAWAVGDFFTGSEQDTLVLKFNGSTWKKVPSPTPGGTHGSGLAAVSADAAKDAWAVGQFSDGSRTNTLALRWNGLSWSQVATPNPGVSQALLTGVTAISPTNAWAVGGFFDGTEQQTLILHWNGASWSQVSSPNAPGNNFLNGIDARSATDIWAVGQAFDDNVTSTLIEHFDGGNWTIVPSPSPSGFDDELKAVSVSSASNAWAVGENFPTAGSETLILRWNGNKWKRVQSPNPGGTVGNDLNGVDIVGNNEAWAVGRFISGSDGFDLILRWNGTKWKPVTGASPGSHNNILNSVSVVSSTDVWAGGFDFANHGGSKNELEHWDGHTWTAA